MTEHEYRALNAINASAIASGQTSMRHMHMLMSGGSKKDTPSMQWGRKVHAAILTPIQYFEDVQLWTGAKRGKAWDEFKAEIEDHDTICTNEELAVLSEMTKAVWSNADARACLENALCEQVITWTAPHVGNCKMRYDAYAPRPHILTDLKTTGQITPSAFWRTAWNMGYHIKMGWYAHGVEIATGSRPQVRLIVLEQTAPYDCWVCKIPGRILDEGLRIALNTARMYRACEAANIFPGIVDGLIDYELPAWADSHAASVDDTGVQEVE